MDRTNCLRFVRSEAARASCQEQTRASLGGGPRPWAGLSPPFHKEAGEYRRPPRNRIIQTGNEGSVCTPSVPSSDFSDARMNIHCRVYANSHANFLVPLKRFTKNKRARSRFKLPNHTTSQKSRSRTRRKRRRPPFVQSRCHSRLAPSNGQPRHPSKASYTLFLLHPGAERSPRPYRWQTATANDRRLR